MGQRSATETLFQIIASFIEQQTWSQAELARKLETRPETVRKHLLDLQRGGMKLHVDRDFPQVYWSVPKNWMPGAIAFKAAEAADLLRMLGRAAPGALRDRLIKLTVDRLASGGQAIAFDRDAIQAAAHEPDADEESKLAIVEDAAAQKVALKMRYYTASKGKESWRHASVHRIDMGPRPQFVATCHRSGDLRRFRVSNVLEARLDKGEAFRTSTKAALDKLDRESFGGFRDVGPVVHCAFFVRNPEASWVAKNLPDKGISTSEVDGGTRFTIDTAGVSVLARFVVGLGEVARPETKELALEIRRIAAAALGNATM